MYSNLPDSFSRFFEVFDSILSFGPVGVSIIGSYGNSNKAPTESSDLDIIFVFNTTAIFELNKRIGAMLNDTVDLRSIDLGVHYQFGFVYSIYFRDNPMRWVDIGIMDHSFSSNYLVNFPKIDVEGRVEPRDNKEIPNNHLNHLSRKLIKHLNKGQKLQATIVAYRYLNWLNVEFELDRLKGGPLEDEFASIYSNIREMNDKEILEYVLQNIMKREPEVWGAIMHANLK